MIVVIADDITGAAEMGGIALRYGLSVVLCSTLDNPGTHEVIVVYTNTRSMKARDAAKIMEELTEAAMKLKPSLFYKKTDSVMRGHILAEMKSQMHAMNVEKGLLVPVNPSSGRTIRNGRYYINNVAVHETSFSIDPEFPIRSSQVVEMLGDEKTNISMNKISGGVANKGITVGEAETIEDLNAWSDFNDGCTLLAGGGSFFNALLQATYTYQPKIIHGEFSTPLCLVSGTTFRNSVDRIQHHPELVSYMPAEIFSAQAVEDARFEYWLQRTIRILEKNNKVIIAIDNRENKKADPQLLSNKLAEMVKRVVDKANIADFLIEGGATAYSIVEKIGWQSFLPVEEMKQGIVRMKVVEHPGLHLTIKPGSYEWPSQWNFN